jgi:hypothetical protein
MLSLGQPFFTVLKFNLNCGLVRASAVRQRFRVIPGPDFPAARALPGGMELIVTGRHPARTGACDDRHHDAPKSGRTCKRA